MSSAHHIIKAADCPSTIIIAGPTASGKSALAMALARALDGVIINADSMQVYEGLPILTAQPSAQEQAQVAHQLYGHVNPLTAYSVGRWCEEALQAIEQAYAADKRPIVVGGTGLYIKALVQGLARIPDVPEAVQAQVQAMMQQLGREGFYAHLCALDPAMELSIRPSDTQRMQRAMAVHLATGKSITYWQQQQGEALSYPTQTIVLFPPRAALYERINTRFIEMVRHGACEEVQAFLTRSLPPDKSAMKAVGVPELAAYLCGTMTLPVAIELAQQNSRRYAKRQMTWLRHQLCADTIVEERLDEAALADLLQKIYVNV